MLKFKKSREQTQRFLSDAEYAQVKEEFLSGLEHLTAGGIAEYLEQNEETYRLLTKSRISKNPFIMH